MEGKKTDTQNMEKYFASLPAYSLIYSPRETEHLLPADRFELQNGPPLVEGRKTACVSTHHGHHRGPNVRGN